MAIKQLSAFVENKPGKLSHMIKALSEANINLRAMSIADTKDFGILRIIVNDTAHAFDVLGAEGYLVKATEVLGVKIGDEPGKLSKALDVLDQNGIFLEYLYAFMARTEKHAYVVIRVEDNEAAEKALEDAGFHIITEADINKL